MKKQIIILFMLAISALIVISCESESPTTGSLRLYFGDSSKRLLAPESTYTEDLDYYDLQLTMPDGKLYKASNIKENSITLNTLPLGDYQLIVFGYKKGVEDYRAKGIAKFRLYANDNSVTVPLVFNGNGTFEITLKYDTTKLDEYDGTIKIDQKIYDSEFNEMEFKISEAKNNIGEIKFTYKQIPSGTYTYKALLKEGNNIISTVIDTLIVSQDKTTAGELTFDIASNVSTVQANIIPIDNSCTIEGEIKKVTETNDSITYSTNIKSKPVYIKNGDLRTTWFVNGQKREETKEITITSKDTTNGLVFVSAIISSKTDGIMGSASILGNFNKTFEDVNPSFKLSE